MPDLWTGKKKKKRKVITDDVGFVLHCGSYR